MTEYLQELKCALRDQHRRPQIGGTNKDPCVDAPDGEYPCIIGGSLDFVLIKDNKISCCRRLDDLFVRKP